MSGRRFYTRVESGMRAPGQMKLLRDVAVHFDDASGELSILSDAPGVVGEELTLGVVSSAGDVELRVRVVESRPRVVSGVLRHSLKLEPLSSTGARRAAPGGGNGK